MPHVSAKVFDQPDVIEPIDVERAVKIEQRQKRKSADQGAAQFGQDRAEINQGCRSAVGHGDVGVVTRAKPVARKRDQSARSIRPFLLDGEQEIQPRDRRNLLWVRDGIQCVRISGSDDGNVRTVYKGRRIHRSSRILSILADRDLARQGDLRRESVNPIA